MPVVIEAYYYAVIGDSDNTRRLLTALDTAELPPLTELMRASIYVAMGQESEAVQILRDSRDNRLLSLPLTAIHPTHDPLRLRSDYRALLIDLGLGKADLRDQLATGFQEHNRLFAGSKTGETKARILRCAAKTLRVIGFLRPRSHGSRTPPGDGGNIQRTSNCIGLPLVAT